MSKENSNNFLENLKGLFKGLKQNPTYAEVKFGSYYKMISEDKQLLEEIEHATWYHLDYFGDTTNGYTNGRIELLLSFEDEEEIQQYTYNIELQDHYNSNDGYYPAIHITLTTDINDYDMMEYINDLDRIEQDFESDINNYDKIKKQQELERINSEIQQLMQQKENLESDLKNIA